jgi:S1-C subfamily serine protease
LEITGRPTEDLLITLQTEVRRSKASAESASKNLVKLPVIGTGTGFYIQKNILVTNNHVIDECNYITNKDGENLSLETTDLVNDIAVLTGPSNLRNLYLSSNPSLGQTIYAGGFPYNSFLNNFNFTSGNVSSLFGPGSNVSEFQFTAPIQPGNSGGAILNEKGGVIGIAVSVASIKLMEDTKSIPQNINFGIKVEVLKDILTENKINYKKGNSFWFKSDQEDVAQLSKDSSIVINCHAEKK